jgi:hypothetical protein
MNIYWSVYNIDDYFSEINYFEPENLYKREVKTNYAFEKHNDFRLCPAVRQELLNTFALKFPYDYSLKINRQAGTYNSDMYDQDFINHYVHAKSVEQGLLSFSVNYIFFCEEEIEASGTGAHFSENDFVKNTRFIPGRFNIGKWFRPTDCQFLLNDDTNFISMKRGDDWSYIKFDTNENITLKRFFFTDKLKKIVRQNVKSKMYKTKIVSLNYWYNIFNESRQKKFILKEIKNNLME